VHDWRAWPGGGCSSLAFCRARRRGGAKQTMGLANRHRLPSCANNAIATGVGIDWDRDGKAISDFTLAQEK